MVSPGAKQALLLQMALLYGRLRALKIRLLNFLIVLLCGVLDPTVVLTLWPRCRSLLVTTEAGQAEVLGLAPSLTVLRLHLCDCEDRPWPLSSPLELVYTRLSAPVGNGELPQSTVWHVRFWSDTGLYNLHKVQRLADGRVVSTPLMEGAGLLFGSLVLAD